MSDEAYQRQLDQWAEALAKTASELMPDWTDASGVLAQASMLVAVKNITPMEYANTQITSAMRLKDQIKATAGGLEQ